MCFIQCPYCWWLTVPQTWPSRVLLTLPRHAWSISLLPAPQILQAPLILSLLRPRNPPGLQGTGPVCWCGTYTPSSGRWASPRQWGARVSSPSQQTELERTPHMPVLASGPHASVSRSAPQNPCWPPCTCHPFVLGGEPGLHLPGHACSVHSPEHTTPLGGHMEEAQGCGPSWEPRTC